MPLVAYYQWMQATCKNTQDAPLVIFCKSSVSGRRGPSCGAGREGHGLRVCNRNPSQRNTLQRMVLKYIHQKHFVRTNGNAGA
jgi:hypothetical protein